MQDKIDVLVPAYNVKKYIKNCLNSLVNQTYKNINIIINENGSTDGTEEIIEEFANKYENITVYHTPNEGSIGKARNFLLGKIQSNYFMFFDSDDYAEPEYIETLYKLLISNDADMAICSLKWEKENKPKNVKKENYKLNKIEIFDKNNAIAELLSYKLYAGALNGKLIKTQVGKGCKFNDKIYHGEDLDFSFKVMQNCNKIVYTYKKLYHYLIRRNSIVTSKFNPKKLTCLTGFKNIIEKVKDNEELLVCAKAMYAIVSAEFLYYAWRDKYKDKEIKARLKQNIKQNIKYVKRNKRLTKFARSLCFVWRLLMLL